MSCKPLQDDIALHVPLKTVKQTGKSREPWFTRELNLLNEDRTEDIEGISELGI